MSLLQSLLGRLFGQGSSQPGAGSAPRPASNAPAPAAARPPAVPRRHALPATTDQRRIKADRKTTEVEPGLRCDFLDLRNSAVKTLPEDIEARIRIDLEGCAQLASLPRNLRTGTLNLRNCTGLAELPSGLDVAFLDLEGCAGITALPDDLRLRGGRLSLRDCAGIVRLPDGLGEVSGLDLAGCLNISTLPEGLDVTSWIDFAGTGIQTLPERLDHVGLRWRGVAVSRRIVFEAHTLTPDEIFGEQNAELRRVMMERYGYDRLIEAADAQELDRDRDAGGERRLLRIPIEGDEDLVCVSVQCPSTGHRFVLRVPPHMTTCRQAVAWTAGFDDPGAYRPVVET